MINTAEYKYLKGTLIHRITGEIDTEEAEIGINELVEEIDAAARKNGKIDLIINAKGMHFASLTAHRTWTQALHDLPGIREKINSCVLVIDDTASGRAEKEFMDSERLKFFFDFDQAINWLRDIRASIC